MCVCVYVQTSADMHVYAFAFLICIVCASLYTSIPIKIQAYQWLIPLVGSGKDWLGTLWQNQGLQDQEEKRKDNSHCAQFTSMATSNYSGRANEKQGGKEMVGNCNNGTANCTLVSN